MSYGLFKSSPLLILLINFYWNSATHIHLHIIYGRVGELWQRPYGLQRQKIPQHFMEKCWQNLALENMDLLLLLSGVDVGANSFSSLMCWVCGAYWTFQWRCLAGSCKYKPGIQAWNYDNISIEPFAVKTWLRPPGWNRMAAERPEGKYCWGWTVLPET